MLKRLHVWRHMEYETQQLEIDLESAFILVKGRVGWECLDNNAALFHAEYTTTK